MHWTEATFPGSFFRSEMDTDLCDVAHFTEHGGGMGAALSSLDVRQQGPLLRTRPKSRQALAQIGALNASTPL